MIYIYNNTGSIRECRLVRFSEGSEVASIKQAEKGEQLEHAKPGGPERQEQFAQGQKKRVEITSAHLQQESQERSDSLPKITAQINQLGGSQAQGQHTDHLNYEKTPPDKFNKRSVEKTVQFDRELKEVEQYASDARDTLEEQYHKEIFDAGMNAITPQEKVAYYRAGQALSLAALKQMKNVTLTPEQIRSCNTFVFAKKIVFGAIRQNLKPPPSLEESWKARDAEVLLTLSEVDRELASQAREKMAVVTERYLSSHPEIAKVMEQANKEDEQAINEEQQIAQSLTTERNYRKTKGERNREAANELQSIIEKTNSQKGIRFELQRASARDNETGEQLTLRIIPRDQRQSEQVQQIAGRVVGSFEIERVGFIRRKENLLVTKDAQTLKECLANVVAHSYTDRK